MFENTNDDIDYYIWIYKHSILNKSFEMFRNKKINYKEYNDIYNKNYFDLIKLHNVLIKA
jgi:hypothetical protein